MLDGTLVLKTFNKPFRFTGMKIMEAPFNQIKKILASKLNEDHISCLPRKWEKIGNVLLIKYPPCLKGFEEQIGKVYADVLNCVAVLDDVGGIAGVYRKPNVHFLYGVSETETVHTENGVRFKLDPQKIMFSSGNIHERLRMAYISNASEVVVDLFAGIGYFSIPMAKCSMPKEIIACEINPVAFEYLKQNIVLNKVAHIVTPVFGDNQIVAPRHVADRVLLGYIHGTHCFLSVALSCLKPTGGVIHFHEVYPRKDIPSTPFAMIQKTAAHYQKQAKLLEYHIIKSFAPGIFHVVLDVEIR